MAALADFGISFVGLSRHGIVVENLALTLRSLHEYL